MTLRLGAPALEVWRRLLRFHRTATAQLGANLQTERSITLDEYDVLYQLNEAGGGLRMSEIADAVVVAPSSCTRVIDRLVSRGWVERQTDATDRRSVRVSITGAGRSALRRAALTHLADVDAIFAAHLSPRDLRDLDRILTRLSSAITLAKGDRAGDHA